MADSLTWWAALAGAALGLAAGIGLRRKTARTRAPAPAAAPAPADEDRLEAVLSHVTQAVLVIDARERLVAANLRGRELLGLGDADVGGSFVPLARSADLVDFARQARAGDAGTREIELHRAPAANIWIRVSGARLGADGQSVVLVADDITRIRRLETLEREFVANVSHDLRTPVTILRGYAETLAQDHATLPAEERGRFIAKVVSATTRLSNLLDGMLALASLESGAVARREPGALAAAAAEVTEAMADKARAAGIGLRLEMTGVAPAADPTLARRLVQNLVDNALAHARGATTVVVRASPAGLEVEDDGAGVAPAELSRLFDRFYRADRSRKQGGAGIGLSIVRQIAELHGGSVLAEPVRPRGLRIRVLLGSP